MSRVSNIIEHLNEISEIKRLKELEPYISSNKKINDKFNELKAIQKKIVNAKEFEQYQLLKQLNDDYSKCYNELLDLPFVEEYLELVDYTNSLLKDLIVNVEFRINSILNNKEIQN